jgi:CPA1 family monovalent cation:H+ antiporter
MNVSSFIALLIIISVVGILAKPLRVSYPLLLVLSGMLLSLGDFFPSIQFTPQLLFSLLLPPLLFEGSIRLAFESLKKASFLIFLLAFPGILFSIFILGPLFHLLLPFSLPVSFLLAALLSATDPVAVLAAFRSFKGSEGISMLIEGESLFNDGTAMASFLVILKILQHGEWQWGKSILDFFLMNLGGIGIGMLLGALFSNITKRIDDLFLEMTLSTILAYGSYITADSFHFSGILSVISAGIAYGNLSSRYGWSAKVKEMLFSFWEYLGFLVNSMIFLLIGTQVNSKNILGYWKPILLVYLLLLGVRLLLVGGSWGIAKAFKQSFHTRDLFLLWWGGLRGALSLALAMGLPETIPQKKDIFFITLGVVFIFLFLNSLTIGLFLKPNRKEVQG